jgi:hypothetical protein
MKKRRNEYATWRLVDFGERRHNASRPPFQLKQEDAETEMSE